MADPAIELEDGVGAECPRERRRDIEAVLVLTLVLSRVLLVERVRRLEGGSGREEVQLNARRWRETSVEPVEEVHHVAAGVERRASGVSRNRPLGQTVDRDEIPHPWEPAPIASEAVGVVNEP